MQVSRSAFNRSLDHLMSCLITMFALEKYYLENSHTLHSEATPSKYNYVDHDLKPNQLAFCFSWTAAIAQTARCSPNPFPLLPEQMIWIHFPVSLCSHVLARGMWEVLCTASRLGSWNPPTCIFQDPFSWQNDIDFMMALETPFWR